MVFDNQTGFLIIGVIFIGIVILGITGLIFSFNSDENKFREAQSEVLKKEKECKNLQPIEQPKCLETVIELTQEMLIFSPDEETRNNIEKDLKNLLEYRNKIIEKYLINL